MRSVDQGSRFDRKRELKERMLSWIATTLGVGPALGNVFYVTTAGSAFESNLKYMGVKDSEIFHSLYTAEDAMTADQNDVLCVTPGTYTETVETDWDKRYCHIIGLGGPNVRGYDTYGTQFYCATADVGYVLHLTGQRCQFHNITFANNAADAHNVSAVKIAGYGSYWKSCQFVGMMAATQAATAGNSSLELADLSSYSMFIDCIIGHTEWQVQGADTCAPLLFSNTGSDMASDVYFKNCLIQHYQAATTRPLVYGGNANCFNRNLIFDGCDFYSFAVNHATACAQAIVTPSSPSTQDVILKYCSAVNVTAIRTTTNGCTWGIGGRETDHLMGVAYPSSAS